MPTWESERVHHVRRERERERGKERGRGGERERFYCNAQSDLPSFEKKKKKEEARKRSHALQRLQRRSHW